MRPGMKKAMDVLRNPFVRRSAQRVEKEATSSNSPREEEIRRGSTLLQRSNTTRGDPRDGEVGEITPSVTLLQRSNTTGHDGEIEEIKASPLQRSSSLSTHNPRMERTSNRLLGVGWSAAALGVRNKLHQWQQFQFFSFGKGPRVYKLALLPLPGMKLTIHALYIQTKTDKKYFAYNRSIEVYTEEAEKDMGDELVEKLNLHWRNYEEGKTNFGFRKQMWEKHGIHSGLSIKEYFSVTMELFERVNDALKLSDLSQNPVTAEQLSEKIREDLTVAYKKLKPEQEDRVNNANEKEKPVKSVEIVCDKLDAQGSASLKELRLFFESGGLHLPVKCKKDYNKCEANTILIFP